jgi:hypothetical protein
MSLTKEKIGVVAGGAPVIAALALILFPFISYIAWACDQLLLNPGIHRDPAGPSTVFDFIGIHAGYMILGIILAFVAFPAFNECIKNMKREVQDHALLLAELRSHDINGTSSTENDDRLSIRELVFRINKIYAPQSITGRGGKLLCFRCGSSISARHNLDFHGSCADCHYRSKGVVAYMRGAGFIAIAVLLALLAITTTTAWIWWVVLGLGMLAFATIAFGHYLRESKARV